MIKKSGKMWCLYSKSTGKKLGCHPTRMQAMKQEMAVQISKARKAGHKIPKK